MNEGLKGLKWGWVINDIIFILEWTIPLKSLYDTKDANI